MKLQFDNGHANCSIQLGKSVCNGATYFYFAMEFTLGLNHLGHTTENATMHFLINQ